jgi:hypothetical protein
MYTLAVTVKYGLQVLAIITFIGLAIHSLFFLPDTLFEFKTAWGLIFVPVATIAIWLVLSYLRVPMPGVAIINGSKLLAGTALVCGLVWCFIEDEWFGRG